MHEVRNRNLLPTRQVPCNVKLVTFLIRVDCISNNFA